MSIFELSHGLVCSKNDIEATRLTSLMTMTSQSSNELRNFFIKLLIAIIIYSTKFAFKKKVNYNIIIKELTNYKP